MPAPTIYFHVEDIRFVLKNKKLSRLWINNLIRESGCFTGEINFIFCSDEYLLKVNRDYLDHDYYTDIITFDYSELSGKQRVISGDVFISIDRIKENAISYKTGFESELRRVMAHGILHIIGFKDKTKEQKAIIREKENYGLVLYDKLVLKTKSGK